MPSIDHAQPATRMSRPLIPSMFVRRLVLIGVLFALALGTLGIQLTRLTVLQGEDHLERAEATLVRRSFTPSVRGRILDRLNRPLAQARPTYAIELEYAVLDGTWARRRAASYARSLHRSGYARLPDSRKQALADRYEPTYQRLVEDMLDRLSEATGTPRNELDERIGQIRTRVESMHASLVESRRREALARAVAEGHELTPSRRAAIDRRALEPIAEQRSAHTVIPQVPDTIAFEFERLASREREIDPAGSGSRDSADLVPILPGLTVRDVTARHRPFESMRVAVDRRTLPIPLRADAPETVRIEGVATHLVGWMRDAVHAEDRQSREAMLDADPDLAGRSITSTGIDRGAYRPGDRVGAAGLEAAAEARLRGLRGLTTRQLDTGRASHLNASPGEDLRTTLDIALQARVMAAMSPDLGLARVQPWHANDNPTTPVGTPLHGAAVVLDVDTGDILAMVSTPSFTRDQLDRDPDAVFDDPIATPWVNRAIDKPYPPGSIAKAPLVPAARARGLLSLSERIACTGHLFPDQPEAYRCWIFKQNPGVTHSMVYGRHLDATDAIMGSCNIYFYTIGRRLGAAGITDCYRDLGVGTAYQLGPGLPEGLDPSVAQRLSIDSFPGGLGRAWNPDQMDAADATLMAIGQGPVAWTPLHAADAFATLARSGVRLPPRLLDDGTPPVAERTLAWDTAATEAALRGLRRVVSDPRGTAEHITHADGTREPIFNTPPSVRIWGKSGTAQAPDIRADPDGDGPEPPRLLRRGDHSWFVLLAGAERPRYAIAVILEYAGSGAKASGPVANQIVHALIAEGYLDDAP